MQLLIIYKQNNAAAYYIPQNNAAAYYIQAE